MKKISILLLIVLAAYVTTKAQTSIPLTNGNCSGTAFTFGTTTGTFTPEGYTIVVASTAALNTSTSGVNVSSSGTMKLVGTNGSQQGQATITTSKVDISSYPVDATFTFSCKLTCGTATAQAQPYNVIMIAYAADGVTVVTANTLTLSKVQPNTNTTSQVTIGATGVMRANTVTPGSDAKYIVFQLQMGKMLANNLTFDDFTLTKLDVAPTTVAGTPSNADLSYQVGSGPSSESTFTVSGTGLGTDNIVLTPASNIEISTTSGSGFVASPSTLSLTPSAGTVNSTTIYTRLKSGINALGAVSASSARVTLFHNTAGTKLVQFTGAVNGMSAGAITGSALSYSFGSGPSGEGSFTVTTYNLTNDLVVTPGSNLEISTTTVTGFQSTAITLPNNTTSQAIFSRLKAGVSVGTYTDATTQVAVSSTGFTGLTKQFTGTVLGIAPTISFASATINKINGDASFTQTASSNSAGAITYSSGSIGVATVDASTGAVTIIGVGSAVITAAQVAEGNYASGDATYTVVVAANVTSAQSISALSLPASGSVTVKSGGDLTIDQDALGITINVQPGGKVTLADTKALTGSTLTLQSNASGTGTFIDNNSTATVTATVQQYLPQGRNWYVASPIETNVATTGNLTAGGATSVSYYIEGSGWQNSYAGNLAVGVGYVAVSAAGSGTNNVSFNGKLNSGDVPVTVTRTETGSSRGFNLVANPYPSYLDWSLVTDDPLNANIGTTIWFRTKTGGNAYTFSTYNSSGGVVSANSANTTISNLIPPMQAFWIRVNANLNVTDLNYPDHITSITFKNTMRAHKDVSGNTFKAPKLNTQQLLRLQISNGTYSDDAVVYFNVNASNAFDKYDSQKMFENESALKPEIYTQIGAEQLVINGLNAIQYDVEIPLGYVAKQAGDYSISRPEMTNFEAGTRIILKDKLNANTETELSDGIAYNFNSDITAATTDRFSLIFRAPGTTTGVNNAGNLNAQVFVNETNQITIIAPEKCNYNIYNAVGMQLEKGTVNGSEANIPICRDCKLQTGVYVVRLSENGKEFTSRVIIK